MKGHWEVQSHSLLVVIVPMNPKCQGARAERKVQAAPPGCQEGCSRCQAQQGQPGAEVGGGACQPLDAVQTRAHEHNHLGSGRPELVLEI